MYEDETADVEGGIAGITEDEEDPAMATGLDREVSTPEANEKYVNASVMFPIGKSYTRGKVIRRKRYADGNAVYSKNENPILHTREYCVEFDDEEVSELT